jgi:hypothetical protein
MFLVTRQQIRPNTSVEFFGQDQANMTPEAMAHIRETYVITGKQVNVERSVSEDGLTLTIQTIYQSEEAFEEYKNDQVVIDNLFTVSSAYCTANGIQQTLVSKDII